MFRSHSDQIAGSLGRLGDENYAYSLWKLPDDTELPDINLENYPIEYLQSAGIAQAMSVEIRRLEADGQPHQYAVAKSAVQHGEPRHRLTYGSQELFVHENEIFTAEEAAGVYVHYFETGDLPKHVSLRELEL